MRWAELCRLIVPRLQVSALLVSAFILLISARTVSAQQLPLLKKMPSELLRYTGGARPDAEGMV